jgi:hypothetical protein
MYAPHVKLSVLLGVLLFLPSCGPQTVELPSDKDKSVTPTTSKATVPPVTVKSEEQKLDPEYQYGADLEKIDREWFVSIWKFIDPSFAFKINKKEECEDEIEYEDIFIFKANGTVLHRDKLENRGKWSFSEHVLKLQLDEFDEDGAKIEPTSPISYHVGKVSERAAILTAADGRLNAIMKCSH